MKKNLENDAYSRNRKEWEMLVQKQLYNVSEQFQQFASTFMLQAARMWNALVSLVFWSRNKVAPEIHLESKQDTSLPAQQQPIKSVTSPFTAVSREKVINDPLSSLSSSEEARSISAKNVETSTNTRKPIQYSNLHTELGDFEVETPSHQSSHTNTQSKPSIPVEIEMKEFKRYKDTMNEGREKQHRSQEVANNPSKEPDQDFKIK